MGRGFLVSRFDLQFFQTSLVIRHSALMAKIQASQLSVSCGGT